MKILHSADFHLDAPFAGCSPEEAEQLRQALLGVPGKIAELCQAERCDLVLLAGDLFDGPYTKESYLALRTALEQMEVPVFIAPGNHDFCTMESPWEKESWPENVHVFTRQSMESAAIPALDCRIYGAGYQSMDCPGLLEGFLAEGEERYHIGLLHADPAKSSTPYCPLTAGQVRESGLDYLALGHVHKTGSFRAGDTLCAWPGCPMGRGYDETGVRGVLLVTLEKGAEVKFVPLDVPHFYDLEVEVGEDPAAAVAEVLPPVGNEDFYRVTLTGYTNGVDLKVISAFLAEFSHLELRDQTIPEADLWGCVGEDTLEGVYFRMLHDAMAGQDEATCRCLQLAAKISRRILDGQEVRLL